MTTICLLGQHEKGYPRNRTVKSLLQKNGFQLLECHSRKPFPQRHFDLCKQFWKQKKQIDLLWITEGGHRFVPLFRLLCLFTHIKIIFDPFTSRYNTRIEDRKLYSPHGLQACICWWQDWSACKAANTLVFDTHEHQEYFYNKYNLKQPSYILPVLIPEENFQAQPYQTLAQSKTILFYGTYIPLQGIQTIIEAANLLKDHKDLHFQLVGQGQTYNEMTSLTQKYSIKNIEFIDPIPENELAHYIQKADICLGIFGDTDKAARVVPNKVIQCAAMGKAIITRNSKAISRYYTHGQDIYNVEANSPKELAEAITNITNNDQLHKKLCTSSQSIFLKRFSQKACSTTMKKICKTN